MALASPQATGLPQFKSLGDEVRAFNNAKYADIDPPRIITLTGNSDLVFDARINNAFGDRKPVSKLTLHNLGVNAMYYAMNQACNTDVGQFHDIIAGGSALKDGLGSLVDLSHDQPNYVTVKGTAGELIAVVVTYASDSVQVG